MTQEPTDPDKKEALLQRVTAELSAAGLNVTRSGDDITVHEEKAERAQMPATEGASTARNLGMVLVAAIAVPIAVYVVAAIYFGLALGLMARMADPAVDPFAVGIRAGAVAAVLAAAIGATGAILVGLDAKTGRGERDRAAFVLALVLGVPLAIFALTRLPMGLDALLHGHKLTGILAGWLFLFLGSLIAHRAIKQR